jgi:hypothetical protein
MLFSPHSVAVCAGGGKDGGPRSCFHAKKGRIKAFLFIGD